jgi:hypothetical protein
MRSSILKVDQLQDSGGNAIITSDGSGNITTNKVGITMADQWRLTATTNSGTDADVTSNWERNDNTSYGSIGTGLTESSGIFSFPQTGIYSIYFSSRTVNAISDTSAIFQLFTTVDNSNYIESAVANTGNASGSAAIVSSGSNSFIFDVTNTATHKFKFATASFATNTFLTGETVFQRTGFTVIRLGDT